MSAVRQPSDDALAPVHVALTGLIWRAVQAGAADGDVVAFVFSPGLVRGQPLRTKPFDIGVLFAGHWVCVTSHQRALDATNNPRAPEHARLIQRMLRSRDWSEGVVPVFVIENRSVTLSPFIVVDGAGSDAEVFDRSMAAAIAMARPHVEAARLGVDDVAIDLVGEQIAIDTRSRIAERYQAAPVLEAEILRPIPPDHVRGVVRVSRDHVVVGDFPWFEKAKGNA